MLNYKLILLILIFGTNGWAAAQFLTYEGYVETSAGLPVTTAVNFKFQITNPTNSCVLYEETQSITPSNGRFTARVGPGGPGTQVVPGGLTDFSSIFSNLAGLTGASSCTYTPSANDARGMNVYIMDGTYSLIGSFYLGANSFALSSERLGGYLPSQVLTFSSPVTAPRSSADYTELVALLSGTSAQYLKPGSAGVVTSVTASAPLIVSGTTAPSISISQASSGSNGYLSSTDWNAFNSKLGSIPTLSGDVTGTITTTSVDRVKGIPVSITTLTLGNLLKYNGSNWANSNLSLADVTTGLGFTPVNKTGDTMMGSLILSADPTVPLGAATKQSVENNFFKQGGNAFALSSNIGTNDAFDLNLKTNNTSRMTVTSAGNVGIGTNLPAQKLSVAGTIESTSGGFKFPDGTIQTSASLSPALTQTFSPAGTLAAGGCFNLSYSFAGAAVGDVLACSVSLDGRFANAYVTGGGFVMVNFCSLVAHTGVFPTICKIIH